jgi:hypothetical protein
MKRIISCLLLLLPFVFLNSCAGRDETGKVTPSPIPTPTQTEITENPISVPTPFPENSSERADFLKLYSAEYYQVIKTLINEYGFYSEDEQYGKMGFLQGMLIDFEDDGTPELVCIYRKDFFCNVSIYRYTADGIVLLQDVSTGDSLFGDNISAISFAYVDGKHYLVTQNCDWSKTERVYVFSVEKGVLQTKSFYAESDTEDIAPPVYKLYNCKIDNEDVTEETYTTEKEYYYQNALNWNQLNDGDTYRFYEKNDAVQFITLLATDAGISRDDVDNITK